MSLQTPRGEYVVLVPHTPVLFKRTQMGTQSSEMRHPVAMWLKHNVGYKALGLDDVSAERPWRERVWKTGIDSQHAFLFYNRAHAMLFKLTYGGNI